MIYPVPFLRLLVCAGLGVATAVAAQQPGASLVGCVRAADSRKPLAGARVTFGPAEPHDIALLRGWIDAPPSRSTTTDAKGNYRLRDAARAGYLLVQHADGLGALIHRTGAGTFRQVLARPMGEIVLPAGETSEAFLLAMSPGGGTAYLGQCPGTTIRLPEGSYRVLHKTRKRYQEFRCRVVSGRRLILESRPATGRSLKLYEGFGGRVTLKGWPHVALPAGDKGSVMVPAGPGPRVLQIWEERSGAVLLRDVWCHERVETLSPSPWKLQQVRVRGADGQPVAGAWCFSCYGRRGDYRIVSRSRTDGEGRANVADVRQQPTGFVVVLKRGFALGHMEAFQQANPLELRLQRGVPTRLLVLGPKGHRLPDAEVVVRWPDRPWARRVSATDVKGDVRFEDLPKGKAAVRLLGTPFLAGEHAIEIDGTGKRTTVHAQPGFRVAGQVVLPSGRPAANALVTLRDPTGTLDLEARVACTGADGRFLLVGLPQHVPVILTASLEAGGRTWTTPALPIQPEAVDLRLELVAEDPPQPAPRRRGKDR